MDKIITLAQLIWIVAQIIVRIEGNPDAKRLYDDLIMKGYNQNVRPTTSYNKSTIITFGIRLAQIVRVDEVNQILTINLWAEHKWNDPRFIWNVHEYNNISMLFVPAEKLWLPDIVLYNNADGDYTITKTGKAVIYSDGRVIYNPPMQFKSSCSINVEFFPFDEQSCHLKFGPWTHDATKVDVQHSRRKPTDLPGNATIAEAVSLSEYQRSVEWDLMEVTAREHRVSYTCCPDTPYPDVTFFISLRRKHLYYVINLVIPCMSMNILTVLAFYLPSYSGEKIGITISIFLSLSLFQLFLFDLTPSTSLKLPLIGKYILVTSLLVTISVMTNTVILNMNHRYSSTHEMSRFVRWLFLGILSRLLYMNQPSADKKESPLDENMFSHNKEDYSDMSHYGNPYRGDRDMLRPQEQHNFIGFNPDNWDLNKVCSACQKRRMAMYSPNVQKGFDGICFLANHYRGEDEGKKVIDEWRFVALIFDRVLLWIYIVITLIISLEIFLKAPALRDSRQPIK